jgi:transposase
VPEAEQYEPERFIGVDLGIAAIATTSTGCHIDNKNRASQSLFLGRNCGVVAHADRNASRNIARKGEAVWTAGRESRVPTTP